MKPDKVYKFNEIFHRMDDMEDGTRLYFIEPGELCDYLYENFKNKPNYEYFPYENIDKVILKCPFKIKDEYTKKDFDCLIEFMNNHKNLRLLSGCIYLTSKDNGTIEFECCNANVLEDFCYNNYNNTITLP